MRLVSLVIFLYLITSCFSKNVLILLADDGGFELGVYRNRVVQTPNIDALAKNSLIFNEAHTSVSSCSPSRAALLTGMPTHQNGMYGLHHGVHHFDSFDGIESLPSVLKRNNILTGIIGKKHVGPEWVYPFDFSHTEETQSILQVGRNITKMKLLAKEFLEMAKKKSFFLYIGFHDPHRCGHTHPQYGSFCEKFGNGESGFGTIPDWNPIVYQPDDVIVPYYVQDTPAAREDIAAQYTTISRLDAGVGLMLEELRAADLLNDTLVIYTSDNGIPFAAGRTNLYDSGSAVPLMISSPDKSARKNQITGHLTSLMDLAPTVLDWFGLLNRTSELAFAGRSLLPLLEKETPETDPKVFYSHNLHEISMYYPMRAVRTKNYKLIHNLFYSSPFPIDQDLYVSPAFQDLLKRTKAGEPTNWYRSMKHYAHRPEWELFDMHKDPEEVENIAYIPKYSNTLEVLKKVLKSWQKNTSDPWLCAPNSVFEHDSCMPLLVCRKFIKKGSSNDVSPLPFICGTVSSFLWYTYGTLIDDTALTMVNLFGILFFSSYVIAHVMFSTKKVTVTRQVLVVAVLTTCAYVFVKNIEDAEEAKKKLGFIACGVSLSFFAAPLANLAHVINVKSSESLPLPIITMSLICTFLWSLYGYIIQDTFVAYPNILAFLLSSFQMSLFLIYPSR